MLFCSSLLFAQNNGIYFWQSYDNYIITPDNSAINVINNFSIEFWTLPNKITGLTAILQEGKCSNSTSSYSVIFRPDSTLNFVFNCNGNCNYSNEYKCSTKVLPGACLHVAISYSSAGVKIYFNGLLQPGQYTTGSYCGNLYVSNQPLLISTYRYLNETLGAWYYGMLDELRIWNRVLSSAEIIANYQNPLIGNETGLKLYYKFDTNITGPSATVTNYATATGSALNWLTYSTNSTSPNTITDPCFNYTGVEENVSGTEDFSIFPNPTNGIFLIKSNNGINEIKIYNVLGEKIYKIKDCKQMKSIEINLSYYPKGVYFVKINDNNKIYTQKILIK